MISNLKRFLLFVVPGLVFGGCALTPPAEDPVLIKLTELERRMQNIERVVQNQSLVNLTQQVSAVERSGGEKST